VADQAAGVGPGPLGPLRSRVRVFSSVRARTTLVGVVVVGVALVVGAVGLVSLLRTSMTEGVETTARAQLNDVVSILRLGQLPAQLPSGRGDTFTQVVAPDGKVIATSATLLATTPMSRVRPGEEGVVIHTIPTLTGVQLEGGADSDGPYLLVAQSIPGPIGAAAAGPVTVYVAATLHPVVEATNTVSLALTAGLPALVALVAALIWIFGGRALRPVEAIRAEVADISGRDLHRRVPEPSTNDEVALLARTMNQMLDRLESSASAQHRFVADASHELRSPLAALRATLEVAAAHPGDRSLPEAVSGALEETTRLQRLVDDLLALASTSEPSADQPRQEVDLDEIILREARATRASSQVTLDLSKVSAGRVVGDRDKLTRVVRNLLDNARRHAASVVSVELVTVDDTVILTVQDDGAGIAPDERDRIFERFARLDEARDQDAGGTGLGLAISKEIVTAHRGTIYVADSPVGARFEIRLPAAEPSVGSPEDDPATSEKIEDKTESPASAAARLSP
jgi:signal transduction histidine kinase